MAVDVPMPVITEAGEDAVVTAWFVDEGGACGTGDLLAEVQAEKVADEVRAPAAGYVVGRVAINAPVPQGDPICRIAESVEATATAGVADTPAPAAAPSPGGGVRASPAARRVARELGVDLASVTGSGPDGRITESDIRAAGGGDGRPALRSVIARNLRRSHAETVPVTLFSTVDLGPSVPSGLTARVVKAAAGALAEHPALNGRRNGDAFTSAPAANISVAIQTAEGLVAPVVRNADSKTVEEIAAAIEDLAARARDKSLSAADYQDGTFSVSNLGPYGIDGFTPVINLPEVAILGVGAARRVPVVDQDGTVTTGHQMVLSLTFDHAFVDGAPAAEFLRAVAARLDVTYS